MQIPPSFACVLVGEESLLVRCAERLVARGHSIVAVAGAAPAVREWADSAGVRTIDPGRDLAAELEGTTVDLLLSVANRRMLPPSALRIARRAAVNFHDGPLPERSGLNVPVWSIVEGADQHGVTWHVMTEGVDRGPVIAEERFPIAQDETAFTLNIKCYEAASASFERVLDALESASFEPAPQVGEGRQYRRDQRPAAAAVLDWSKPAAELERLVRALDFGPYANPVSLPAIIAPNGAVLFVARAALEAGRDGAPGTVLEIGGAGPVVATTRGALALSEIIDDAGEPVAAAGLAAAGISTAATLPLLGAGDADALRARAESLARHEPFWVDALSGAAGPELPYARVAVPGANPRHIDAPAPAALASLADTLGTDARETLVGALGIYITRLTGAEDFALGLRTPESVDAARSSPLFADIVPLPLRIEGGAPAEEAARAACEVLRSVRTHGSFAKHLPVRFPSLRTAGPFRPTVTVDLMEGGAMDQGAAGLVIEIGESGSSTWHFDGAVYRESDVRAMQGQLARVVSTLAAGRGGPVAGLDLLSEDERTRLLSEDGHRPIDDRPIHARFEAQVDATPDREALRFRGRPWTYRELDDSANRIAHRLVALGVGPGARVGVGVRRSHELIAALLGVLKAGAAYVPLDPAFPPGRLSLMIEDAGLSALVTEAALKSRMPTVDAPAVDVDDPTLVDEPASRPGIHLDGDALAYVLYTSGSTGVPKGVMVEHRQVAAFFGGMDDVIAHESPGTWLAVTSVSFDISVLELLWTLARGFTVVVQPEDRGPFPPRGPAGERSTMGMSLFYFASDEGGAGAAEKYGLLLDGARFADANGFEAVWTPERHFHAFGGLYPNPSVASAAIAAVTKRVGIRAGSVVSPLHHPARIAEEWSVVDNLSGGRVGISFASGWQPNDFVLRPDAFADRKERFMDGIAEVRALWRGETRAYPGPGGGQVDVRTLPRPVQPELPTWVTAAGNPETFREAGAQGFNLLTHLLGQRVEELEEKIGIYREARAAAGLDPAAGRVTLMLHTFVGENDDAVREIVREPMKSYLGSSFDLVKAAAWDFPAFKRAADSAGRAALDQLAPEDLDEVLEFSFARYYETGALFGEPATCLRMIERVRAAGVDEVACLIDFGVPASDVREMLPALARLREAAVGASPDEAAEAATLPEAIRAEGVTHLQCTPTQARLMTADPDGLVAMAELQHLMVGGEALPGALADELLGAGVRRLTNLYGPTEATVWASAHEVSKGEGTTVPLGTPLANYRLYVMDDQGRPLPDGVAGELWIAGAGVARGYFGKDDLTSERFRSDPFHAGERMYGTGDLVRRAAEGTLEFLGRLDAQVKIRGFRVELGEIEAALQAHPAIREAAATVREDVPGESRLVAYWVPKNGDVPDRAAFRAFLEERLPAYMVPDAFIRLEALPTTPNQKLDRRALPVPVEARPAPTEVARAPARAEAAGPQGDVRGLEEAIASIWREVLGIDDVPPTANFFDLGGHSLLALQVQGRVREALGHELRVVDIFRHPSVRALASHLGGRLEAAPERVVTAGADRGAGRRAALLQRRR